MLPSDGLSEVHCDSKLYNHIAACNVAAALLPAAEQGDLQAVVACIACTSNAAGMPSFQSEAYVDRGKALQKVLIFAHVIFLHQSHRFGLIDAIRAFPPTACKA